MVIITSDQSNLTKRPHRRRTRTVQWYHQVALICTPPNTCLLRPTGIQNPNGILIGSAIFAQLMAECCRTCPDMSFPLKKSCPLSWGDLNRHLIHCSFGPSESTAQTASRSVQPFLQSSLQRVAILYSGPPLLPSKLPLPMGRSGPPSNTWFRGSTESSTQTTSRLVETFCRAQYCDRQTDRQITLVGR